MYKVKAYFFVSVQKVTVLAHAFLQREQILKMDKPAKCCVDIVSAAKFCIVRHDFKIKDLLVF